jgi:soluble lytic murein transglycosylase
MKSHKARTLIFLVLLLAAAAVLLRYGYLRFMKTVYPLGYSEIVTAEAKADGLDPMLVYSVIRAESGFDPEAQSHAGALGLMQLTPDTLDWLQKQRPSDLTYTEKDLFTPRVNIRYGCHFLELLLKKYGDRRTVLCAYNAGIGTVNSWLKNSDYSEDGRSLRQIPYPETRNYVAAVEQNIRNYNNLYQS